tara:strand:- start:45 stop:302 length:258 start_codon:yes stop_codon:yes gene_type:complete
MKTNELKVTGVRYFETRRGLGYECTTNVRGARIWNDGSGGGTYVDAVFSDYTNRDFHNTFFPNISYGSMEYEQALEKLISKYEGV